MIAMNSFTRKIHRLEDLHCLKIERELRQQLLLKMSMEQTKQELAEAAHTDDARLIELLLQAGFTAETLPALSLAPIALVAWGSGYVTAEERAVAMQAIFESEISGNQAAIAKFESWLETRPAPNLFYLWANITTDRLARVQPDDLHADAIRISRLAKRVALASGGFMGFGMICSGEQVVIDRLRNVFQRKSA